MRRKSLNDADSRRPRSIRGYRTQSKEWAGVDGRRITSKPASSSGASTAATRASKRRRTTRRRPSCYQSHPALKLPGTELVIYGGSCISPAVKDADVYIGFDAGMTFTRAP